jgi:hypothetical protein
MDVLKVSRFNSTTCDEDVMVVGLDEPSVHIRSARVGFEDAEDVMTLPCAGTDDADDTQWRVVGRVGQATLNGDQAMR